MLCISLLTVMCSCIEDPDENRCAPDVEGRDGETSAYLYNPGNPYARKRLPELARENAVAALLLGFDAAGYRYVPGGSVLLAGATGTEHIEIALLCLLDDADSGNEPIYIAVVDTGNGIACAPARLVSGITSGYGTADPKAGEPFFEPLPGMATDAPRLPDAELQSQRWVWDEFWTCFNSLLFAGAAGCSISCMPNIPQGYMVCYLACVGGATIAAVIRCTFQQLFQ